MAWPALDGLEIIWCLFPYRGHKDAKRHPCLALDVSEPDRSGATFVIVSGGASANKAGKWVRPIDHADFVLQLPEELREAGLSNPTAFRFEALAVDSAGHMTGGTILTLPYTEDYFVAVPPKSTPVIGSVDLKRARTRDAFKAAAQASNLQRLLAEEQARYSRDGQSILR